MAMPSATAGGAAVILLLAILGALAGTSLWIMESTLELGDLVALLMLDAAIAAFLAIYVRLRTARAAMQVAAIAGAVGVASFFAMTIALDALYGAAPAPGAFSVLLGFAPAAAGATAAGGAGYLARGLRRARTERFSA